MQTIKNNNVNTYLVDKYDYKNKDEFDALDFESEDYKYIEEITSSKINNVYSFYDDESFRFQYVNKNYNDSEYFRIGSNPYILDVKEDKIFDNVIGRKPQTSNEIVVSKFLADFIIKYGIILENEEEYFPKDYNDLISSNKEIKLGNSKVTIVGIMNEDNSLFEDAKEKGYFNDKELKDFYANYSLDFVRDMIYTKDFVDTIEIENEENIIKEGILDKLNIINYVGLDIDGYTHENINFIDTDVEVITSDGIKTINSLNKDEIILSVDSVRKLFKDFDTEYMDYIKENDNKSLTDFAVEFFEKNIRRKDVTLLYGSNDDSDDESKQFSVNIIGISEDENDYISSFYIDELNEHKNITNFKDLFMIMTIHI